MSSTEMSPRLFLPTFPTSTIWKCKQAIVVKLLRYQFNWNLFTKLCKHKYYVLLFTQGVHKNPQPHQIKKKKKERFWNLWSGPFFKCQSKRKNGATYRCVCQLSKIAICSYDFWINSQTPVFGLVVKLSDAPKIISTGHINMPRSLFVYFCLLKS